MGSFTFPRILSCEPSKMCMWLCRVSSYSNFGTSTLGVWKGCLAVMRHPCLGKCRLPQRGNGGYAILLHVLWNRNRTESLHFREKPFSSGGRGGFSELLPPQVLLNQAHLTKPVRRSVEPGLLIERFTSRPRVWCNKHYKRDRPKPKETCAKHDKKEHIGTPRKVLGDNLGAHLPEKLYQAVFVFKIGIEADW